MVVRLVGVSTILSKKRDQFRPSLGIEDRPPKGGVPVLVHAIHIRSRPFSYLDRYSSASDAWGSKSGP